MEFRSNPQLPTPSLSPVAEHPSPELELDKETESKRNAAKVQKSLEAPSSDFLDTAIVIDGSLEPNNLRLENGQIKRRASSGTKSTPLSPDKDKVLKLSSAQIHELTSSPHSLPVRAASPVPELLLESSQVLVPKPIPQTNGERSPPDASSYSSPTSEYIRQLPNFTEQKLRPKAQRLPTDIKSPLDPSKSPRPGLPSRAISTPVMRRKTTSARPQNTPSESKPSKPIPPPLKIDKNVDPSMKVTQPGGLVASPMPTTIPLPPLSMATYLQLELSAERPSPLYIYRPQNTDFPYESAKVKYERLLNFLYLPPQLERTLVFGFFTCLDAFLYTFTILPLRFGKAIWMLTCWLFRNTWKEAKDLANFVFWGIGRLWKRRSTNVAISGAATPIGDGSTLRKISGSGNTPVITSPRVPPLPSEQTRKDFFSQEQTRKLRGSSYRHRRTKSRPSALTPSHKADLLKGFLVLSSCFVLMRFDASRMYHNIRGQAAIKLYVIYNVLEVFDRLFAALGQDVLECLFSQETLERKSNGRSKVLRPFFMFVLASAYNVIHATALFYQVITLNVAVNSYSNALLTLLLSNQFVEIKGTVFKKFEKENLFQMTCADVVERFQLFLMLFIIAMRNIVEVGGLTLGSSSFTSSTSAAANATNSSIRSSIIPKSFTMFSWVNGQVLGPFFIVLGSEMLVDWIKHAYITKFNSIKPDIFGRYLDVLAKDYYSNAFADQNLTKRLGLPVIPLSCLFIRAMAQTYKMFIATHITYPMPVTATAVSTESAATSSPATAAALAQIDLIFRRALGRSSFGAGLDGSNSSVFSRWTLDDVIAFSFILLMWGAAWFILLALKLVLGMVLLSFARRRYKGMKEREKTVMDTGGKRVGGWGTVEVEDDKRRWIYVDDPDGLKNLKERDARSKQKEEKGVGDLSHVDRYSMVAKRIW